MLDPKEDSITLMNLRLLAARAGVMSLVKTAPFSVVLAALVPAPGRLGGKDSCCDAMGLIAALTALHEPPTEC